ncbi:putative membrane protein YdjX (TVP38/TMEM64 family) [Paenibacillus sp. LBL]|uniref:TVP38/TMEM64 family protein n=1 Tax=Paenibacillus sp. LBL TaxID=2940563 RepID=UPI002473ACA9|nr:TVP38/TMEM64 family protein [Paenibacillus sp. LBL]MDH6672549.1 putative membrane protein YdjX (TVP38/TMEM64 family) [Paenibacillus sp. LBL]
MVKKLAMALVYIAIGGLIYVYGDAILAWIQTTDSMMLIMFMAVIMALFPVIPYPIVGGVIGAALGPVIGGLITWVGSTAASILMFMFIRYGYQEWGTRMLHRYDRLGKVTTMFERNVFLTILFTRLIPFIPSIIINVYAALSMVTFTSYTMASAVGKIPAMLLFSMVGDNLMTDPSHIIITIGVYGVFLAVTLLVYRWSGFGRSGRTEAERL